MEKRDEIKEAVKSEVIKLMAQEIKNESAFDALKKELMAELLQIEEKEKTRRLNSNDGYDPINEEEAKFKREWGFLYNPNVIKEKFKSKVETELEKKESPKANSFVIKFADKLRDIKEGKTWREMDKFVNTSVPDFPTYGSKGFQVPASKVIESLERLKKENPSMPFVDRLSKLKGERENELDKVSEMFELDINDISPFFNTSTGEAKIEVSVPSAITDASISSKDLIQGSSNLMKDVINELKSKDKPKKKKAVKKKATKKKK